jgi:hypothetical protein
MYAPSSHDRDAKVLIFLISGFSISARHGAKNPVFDLFAEGLAHRAWSYFSYRTGMARMCQNAVRLEMGL